MEPGSTMSATIKVTLDATRMAGRPGYKNGVRPNHRIPGRRNEVFMGALYFKDREILKPGESCVAEGKFIIYSKDESLFVPGFCWEICEASRLTGTAELVEVEKIQKMDRTDA
ncbi:hypothetical protein BA177_13335 [Woeseia oceani]|uniref:Translation elongation factor EFTu/EF1A C-terminal domain-containing protein n=1 Tax=Woeseia oceani TaxID=1548547 RepID=A0A193LHR6_9GAMM|nr:hypothetical protein BA177_13335 [Woeseia oceani]